MSVDYGPGKIQGTELNWRYLLAEYKKPNLRKATGQLLNTFTPYLALWTLMIFMVQLGYSYWIVLVLSLPASLLLVRIFIFFHDCCHNSFFASRRANNILGYISGILTLTPYDDWRRSHGMHHATAQDPDRRGIGDIWTLTVEEYLAAPKLKRLAYRLFRNPFVLFGPGPLVHFLIRQRFPNKVARKRERYSVALTDLAILAIIGGASLTIGLGTYLLIQLLIMEIAATIGLWLFYIQHQVDARIVATTNRNLEEEVRKGRFRQDLYYRLNVFPITVPPLRQRKEDIPLLVQAFIERYARKLGKQITSIQKETMMALQDYPWPGNVRELESVLERAVILCPGPVLQLADKLEISSLPMSSTMRTLEEMERNQILKTLSETRWRIEGKDGAAAILGLHPSTLRARMHKLGILRPEIKESD